MTKRIELLRLDYTFSVLIPMLFAIYLNHLNIFRYLDILVGFTFLAITGNTWNDVIDMRNPDDADTIKRVEGYHPKEIFTIGLVSFILGITLLVRTCIEHFLNFILLLMIIAMVLGYCIWFKPIPILNDIVLAVSHVLLPYLIIKVDAGLPLLSFVEFVLMMAFLAFTFNAQVTHEVIDGDAIRQKFSLRQCQIVILLSAAITIFLGSWLVLLTCNYFFIPFIFFPAGIIYTFRRPTTSTKGVKDVGLLSGNFLLVYFLCLIALQMTGTI